MTGEPGAKGAPHLPTDERPQRQDVLGLGEREHDALLAWVAENLNAGAPDGFRAADLVLDLRARLRGRPGRSYRRVPASILGDDGASEASGRPALPARPRVVDRCRRGGVRRDLAGGQKASVQTGPRCLRGSGGPSGRGRQWPGAGPGERGGRMTSTHYGPFVLE